MTRTLIAHEVIGCHLVIADWWPMFNKDYSTKKALIDKVQPKPKLYAQDKDKRPYFKMSHCSRWSYVVKRPVLQFKDLAYKTTLMAIFMSLQYSLVNSTNFYRRSYLVLPPSPFIGPFSEFQLLKGTSLLHLSWLYFLLLLFRDVIIAFSVTTNYVQKRRVKK